MKKINRLTAFLLAYCLWPMADCLAQAPQGMNYQAVARNSGGVILANQNIGLRFTITDGNGGTVLYKETQNTTTNQFGLFTRSIGSGTPVTGTFSSINWAGTTPWLLVEMDAAGGTSYINMGSSQLLSVPYSLQSQNSNNITGTTNYVSKFTGLHTAGNSQLFDNGTNVGLGTTAPASLFHLHKSSTPTLQFTNSTSGTTSADGGAIYENGSDFYFDNGEPGNLIFNNNGLQRMRITSSGNVGIGTSVPGDKLSIKGGALSFHHTTNDVPYMGIDYDVVADGMRFRSNLLSTTLNTNNMFISRISGNVGIGTTSPNNKLHIHNNASNSSSLQITNNASGSTNFDGGLITQENDDLYIENLEGAGKIFLKNGGVPRMTITSTGLIGINQPNPISPLDVSGPLRVNDGNQGTGKILTSDALGNGGWQEPAAKQVSFKAQLIFNNITVNGNVNPVIFDSTFFNNGNGYNGATGIFTAPSAGLYYFHAQLLWYTTSVPHTFALEIITNDLYQRVAAIAEKSATMNDNPVIGTSALFYLNIGDFVKVVGYEESSGTGVIDNFVGHSHFFGYKIY